MAYPTRSYSMRDQAHPSHQPNFGPAPGNPGRFKPWCGRCILRLIRICFEGTTRGDIHHIPILIPKEPKRPLGTVLPKRLIILSVAARPTIQQNHRCLIHRMETGTMPRNGIQTPSHTIVITLVLPTPMITEHTLTEHTHRIPAEAPLSYLNNSSTRKMRQAAPLGRFVVVQVSLRNIHRLFRTSTSTPHLMLMALRHTQAALLTYLTSLRSLHKKLSCGTLPHNSGLQSPSHRVEVTLAPPTPILPMITGHTHHILAEILLSYLNKTPTKLLQAAPLNRFVVVQVSLRKIDTLFRIRHTRAELLPYLNSPSFHKNLPHGYRKPLARFVVTLVSLRKVCNLSPTPEWVPQPHSTWRPHPLPHTISQQRSFLMFLDILPSIGILPSR